MCVMQPESLQMLFHVENIVLQKNTTIEMTNIK